MDGLPRMWCFPADPNTGQGGPHGLKRDHPRKIQARSGPVWKRLDRRGVACDRAAPPASIKAGPSPHRWSSDGFRRDPVHAGDGVPVARDSQVFPALATLRNHFRAWRDDGVLERMMDAPRDLARERAGRSASPTAAATGSRSVKTTEPGGPSGYDAGKRTRGGKRHAAVDVEGFPIAVQVHAADVRDRDGAPAVIPAMPEKAPKAGKLWADGGCSGPKPEAAPAGHGIGPIPETVSRPGETRGFTVPVAAGWWGGHWRVPWPGCGWLHAAS